MRWGPARGPSSCPCPGPRAPGVRGEAEETAGQRLGRGGVSPTGACSGVWPPRGARYRWRGWVRRLECVSETHKQASSAQGSGRCRARHRLQGRESGGVSLGLSKGSGPCRVPRLLPLPLPLWPGAGLCLLQALVAVGGPCVDLGVACWPNSRWSRVPSNQGDGPLPGQDVSQSVSLETLHPGPGGSEEHAPRAASCCVTPGGRLSPHLAGWWP